MTHKMASPILPPQLQSIGGFKAALIFNQTVTLRNILKMRNKKRKIYSTTFILLGVVLQILISKSSAQTFTKYIATSEKESAAFGIELPTKQFVLATRKGIVAENDPGGIEDRSVFFKLSTDCNILDSLTIENTDSTYQFLAGLLNYDNMILTWLHQVQRSQPIRYMTGFKILIIDTSMSIVHTQEINKPGCLFNYIGNPTLNLKGNLVFPVSYYKTDHTGNYESCMEITPEGEIIRETFYTEQMPYVWPFIVEVPAIHGYHLIDFKRIVELDSTLHYVKDIYNVPQFIYLELTEMMAAKMLNDSCYVIEGKRSEKLYDGSKIHYRDAAWNCMQSDGNWKNYPPFNYGEYEINDLPWHFDFKYPEHMWFQVASIDPFYGIADDEMYLYKFNSEGERLKEIRKGGLGNINPGCIIATADSGCLWVGNYWNWHTKPEPDEDIVLIKLNADGVLPSAVNVDDEKAAFCTLYPNPGIDYLNIENNGFVDQLQLFDIVGRLMFEKKIDNLTCKVSTASIPEGVYIYRMLHNKAIVKSGKWVKL